MDFDAIRLTSLLSEGVWGERIVHGLAFLFFFFLWYFVGCWVFVRGDGEFSSFRIFIQMYVAKFVWFYSNHTIY